MKQKTATRKNGFTLVELVIVVLILSVLAAIVVPQFAASTDDAKVAALDSSLAGIRNAVDLYYQQHGHYPSSVAASGATCPGTGTAGTGAVDSEQAFLEQLTRYTNAAGQACSTTDATFKYGPYYKKDALPNDPVVETINTVAVVTAGDLAMTADGTNGGWKFDNITGKFIMNHTDYDDR